MFHAGLQQIHRRARPAQPLSLKGGISAHEELAELPADGGEEAHLLGPAKGDGKLTFDKLTDLYHSGTKHEEDQPAHLVIHDTNICNTRCVKEFGSPCQNFCPANVYEMVDDASQPNGKRISLNPSNCVHCKTCDIADPVPDHHLGSAGRWRRSELRRHVMPCSRGDSRPGCPVERSSQAFPG